MRAGFKLIVIVGLVAVFAVQIAGAQMGRMMAPGVQEDDHTLREEAEGKIIWQKLENEQVSCADLTDEDFGALGEYFMGQMLGEAHPAMNEIGRASCRERV